MKPKSKSFLNSNTGIILGLLLGILSGIWDTPLLTQIATVLSQIFINLLKLLSTPIIFFSILATVSGMNNLKEFKHISSRLIKYTLLTTYIAAFVALLLFVGFDVPNNLFTASSNAISSNAISTNAISTEASTATSTESSTSTASSTHSSATASTHPSTTASHGYLHFVLQTIPSNLITPFLESHVIAVLFLAILFSFGTLALPDHQRSTIHTFVSSINALFMKLASWIIYLIPIAIWSFITLFIKEIQGSFPVKPLAIYLSTIVAANLIQGFIILPLLVKSRGISPKKLASDMMPALSFAFFSKSSSATLPMTIRCAEENAKLSKKLSNIALPLCTAINMNGCAAFIFVTVLFVSMSNGIHFSMMEMILWTFIATIAAIGNAGVPMGCYFLSTAFLAAMDVPLNLMAIILPFHALIDMLETAINVWSDSCVVAIVDSEMHSHEEIAIVGDKINILEDKITIVGEKETERGTV